MSIIKVNKLTVFREIFSIYCECNMKHINTVLKNVKNLNVTVGSTHSYHWALNG